MATGIAEYVRNNVRMNKRLYRKGIGERVVCSLEVDTLGKVGNIVLVDSVHPYYDKEAVRLLENMPLWTPAEINGKKVVIKFALPFAFTYKQKKKK